MLDFWLSGIELKERGNRIKYSVDGTPYFLNKWAPVNITGLKPGKHAITLEAVDKYGQRIDANFGFTQRDIIVEPSTKNQSPQ